jgi:hypothetical protein
MSVGSGAVYRTSESSKQRAMCPATYMPRLITKYRQRLTRSYVLYRLVSVMGARGVHGASRKRPHRVAPGVCSTAPVSAAGKAGVIVLLLAVASASVEADKLRTVMPFMRSYRPHERMRPTENEGEVHEKDCSYRGPGGHNIATWRMLVGPAGRRMGWSRTRWPGGRAWRWWSARRGHRTAYDVCDLTIHLTRSAPPTNGMGGPTGSPHAPALRRHGHKRAPFPPAQMATRRSDRGNCASARTCCQTAWAYRR